MHHRILSIPHSITRDEYKWWIYEADGADRNHTGMGYSRVIGSAESGVFAFRGEDPVTAR